MSMTDTTPRHKTPIAYYGSLYDEPGIFLQVDGSVSFRDHATEQWRPVDLPTLTTWAVLNGRMDLADVQLLADGNRAHRCSRTLQRALFTLTLYEECMFEICRAWLDWIDRTKGSPAVRQRLLRQQQGAALEVAATEAGYPPRLSSLTHRRHHDVCSH